MSGRVFLLTKLTALVIILTVLVFLFGGDLLKKGITREMVLAESEKMIIKSGFEGFSLRTLSEKLGIKPASLYNHISGIDEIYVMLAEKAASMMRYELSRAVEGKPADEAFISGAVAYREFAEKNRKPKKRLPLEGSCHGASRD